MNLNYTYFIEYGQQQNVLFEYYSRAFIVFVYMKIKGLSFVMLLLFHLKICNIAYHNFLSTLHPHSNMSFVPFWPHISMRYVPGVLLLSDVSLLVQRKASYFEA